MIHSTRYYISKGHVPYPNLALEEYLLYSVQPGECILYLWQNEHTVVIGRNQNCWKECKIHQLEEEGGYLVRRLSGGGAVFHDLGNLNFTFLVHKEDYDVNRQLEVIIRAVRSFGLQAEQTGRNDITLDGRKFSGNAFYSADGRSYHHGTILIRVDMESLSRYLNVSAKKIQSKGVDSVKSRVVNLSDYNPEITIESMAQALIRAFGEVYGSAALEIPESEIDQQEIRRLTDKFASDEWKFGRSIPFSVELEERYPWGDIQLQLQVDRGIVQEAKAYSDGMDVDFVAALPEALKGALYREDSLLKRIDGVETWDKLTEQMAGDIKKLIHDGLE